MHRKSGSLEKAQNPEHRARQWEFSSLLRCSEVDGVPVMVKKVLRSSQNHSPSLRYPSTPLQLWFVWGLFEDFSYRRAICLDGQIAQWL